MMVGESGEVPIGLPIIREGVPPQGDKEVTQDETTIGGIFRGGDIEVTWERGGEDPLSEGEVKIPRRGGEGRPWYPMLPPQSCGEEIRRGQEGVEEGEGKIKRET